MNAISPAFAASAGISVPSLHGVGARLAQIHQHAALLQNEPEPRSAQSRRIESKLKAEQDALHELVLTARPVTLADAAVVAMVLSYEISIVACPGPNRGWACSKDVRAEALADAFARAAVVICQHIQVPPESIGGAYYAAHLLGDEGAAA